MLPAVVILYRADRQPITMAETGSLCPDTEVITPGHGLFPRAGAAAGVTGRRGWRARLKGAVEGRGRQPRHRPRRIWHPAAPYLAPGRAVSGTRPRCIWHPAGPPLAPGQDRWRAAAAVGLAEASPGKQCRPAATLSTRRAPRLGRDVLRGSRSPAAGWIAGTLPPRIPSSRTGPRMGPAGQSGAQWQGNTAVASPDQAALHAGSR